MTLRTIRYDDSEWQVVPREPNGQMESAGGHSNSEWLNDNAPIGESRYAMPMRSVWRAMLAAAPEPPAQEPMTYEEIDGTTRAATNAMLDYIYEYGTSAEGSQRFIRQIARAIEAHYGIGKGEPAMKRNCPPPSWMFPRD